MSSEVKKYLLVDSNNIDQLFSSFNKKARLEPIANRELKRLDQLMLEIVNNKEMSENEKVEEYNKRLTDFQNTLTNSHPPQVEPPNVKNKPNKVIKKEMEDIREQPEQPVSKTLYDATIGIDHRYKPRARKLLSLLSDLNILKYSDSGEVILHGEKITGSNVSDLLNRAVNPKANAKHLIGWEKFLSSLDDANVPQSILTTIVKPIKTTGRVKRGHTKPTIKRVKSDFDSWKKFDE